jgi:hypothetical protein
MNWIAQKRDPVTGCMMYKAAALTVLVADIESAEYKQTKRWHLSISHPMRYPKWDEISDARYSLIPNEVTMYMYLPPREEYVNFHKNCFHLHESREPDGQ